MSDPAAVIQKIGDFVWGPYLLIPLLLLTGLFLTLRLRGLQFRKLWHSLYVALIVRREKGAEGDISHFQALMTALAATVGTGNIVGVATAIATGGPGALFWMWMTGLVGMATKFSEALLSVKFRVTDARGEQCGGPMYYLANGIQWRGLGKMLGWLFALFAVCASFGIGNMVQSNSVAHALNTSFQLPVWATGLILAVAAGLVILGGIKSIGRFTGVFVPVMIVAYMFSSGLVLVLFAREIPAALGLVFEGAFSGTAAAGGFAGAAVRQAIRFGVARGIFSNESGLGSAGIAAAAAQTREPVRQALVSMTQTFIDTIVVCSFTGLAILVTGGWKEGLNGAELTQYAFSHGLPGEWGGWIVAVCLSMFAFSTMLGWSYYGEKSIEYLMGERFILPYRILFIVAIFFGALRSLDFVWGLSDVMNGLMALPNLVGLLLLSGVIVRETQDYFKRTGE
ncbi:MAG: sodium:alanine symporter family protein [Thermoanaerobaculia bacterium]|jgi:AGCS family alanine or glycine:cation symporter